MIALRIVPGVVAALVASAVSAAMPDDNPNPRPVEASVEFEAGYERYENAVVFIDEFDELRAGTGTVQRSSTFYAAAAGIDFDIALRTGGSWLLSFDAELRRTPSLPELHRNRTKAATGFAIPVGRGEIEVTVNADDLVVFNADFRRKSRGAQLRAIDRGDSARTVLALQWQRYRHDGFDDLYDADRVIGSLLHRRVFAVAGTPALAGRIALGAERNRWRFDDLSSRDRHIEVEASVSPAVSWQLSALASNRRTEYGGPAPGLDFTRRDLRGGGKLMIQHTSGVASDSRITRLELERVERSSNDPVAKAAVSRAGVSFEWTF